MAECDGDVAGMIFGSLRSCKFLASCKWNEVNQCVREVKRLLLDLGDTCPVIQPTIARGIVGVSTVFDPVVAVRKLRDLFDATPERFVFTLKFVPTVSWCETEIEAMKDLVVRIRSQIEVGETYAIEIEKRRYTGRHKIDIAKALGPLIARTVDLERPHKILRIDIIGRDTAISVLEPSEIFSIVKERKRLPRSFLTVW